QYSRKKIIYAIIYVVMYNSFGGVKNMSIRPDYLTLEKLFFKRVFRVPNYQRAYSWETKQRRDLFEDLEKNSRLQR
ncbi:MAG: DUF262 domain-containing protein, partial [bacterium]